MDLSTGKASSDRPLPYVPSCTNCAIRNYSLCGVPIPNNREGQPPFLLQGRNVAARQILVRSGEIITEAFTINTGWAFRFKLLRDGRRQILGYYLPGDLIAAEAFLESQLEFSVQALTDLSVCVFDLKRFKAATDENPSIKKRFNKMLLHKFHANDERLSYLGKVNATERLLHFIMFIYRRLLNRGLVEGNIFFLPILHEHIADTIGLTTVHLSRTFAQLRKDELIAVKGQQISILDLPNILVRSGLELDYLDKEKENDWHTS